MRVSWPFLKHEPPENWVMGVFKRGKRWQAQVIRAGVKKHPGAFASARASAVACDRHKRDMFSVWGVVTPCVLLAKGQIGAGGLCL